MFYLEDEKTLVLTSENKKDILNALKLINKIKWRKDAKIVCDVIIIPYRNCLLLLAVGNLIPHLTEEELVTDFSRKLFC